MTSRSDCPIAGSSTIFSMFWITFFNAAISFGCTSPTMYLFVLASSSRFWISPSITLSSLLKHTVHVSGVDSYIYSATLHKPTYRMTHSCALRVTTIICLPRTLQRQRGQPRGTWLWTTELNLQQHHLGLNPAWKWAQDVPSGDNLCRRLCPNKYVSVNDNDDGNMTTSIKKQHKIFTDTEKFLLPYCSLPNGKSSSSSSFITT